MKCLLSGGIIQVLINEIGLFQGTLNSLLNSELHSSNKRKNVSNYLCKGQLLTCITFQQVLDIWNDNCKLVYSVPLWILSINSRHASKGNSLKKSDELIGNRQKVQTLEKEETLTLLNLHLCTCISP